MDTFSSILALILPLSVLVIIISDIVVEVRKSEGHVITNIDCTDMQRFSLGEWSKRVLVTCWFQIYLYFASQWEGRAVVCLICWEACITFTVCVVTQ